MKHEDNQKRFDICQVPDEIIQEIILWLEIPELFLRFALTCKKFETIANSNYSYKMLCERLLKELRINNKKMSDLSEVNLPNLKELFKNLCIVKRWLTKWEAMRPSRGGNFFHSETYKQFPRKRMLEEAISAIKIIDKICNRQDLGSCLVSRFALTGEPVTFTHKRVVHF